MPAGGRDGGQDRRLRAVGPETGRFLNIVAKGLLISMELHAYKTEFAKEMAEKAGLAEHIDFKIGDAVEMIKALPSGVDFVLVDLWKDLYIPCLEAFYPKLNPGAIIVADNMFMPGNEDVKRYGEAVRAKLGITSVLLPVGSGIEVSRYDPV
jgi:predicted O-methyltransferase YrrM